LRNTALYKNPKRFFDSPNLASAENINSYNGVYELLLRMIDMHTVEHTTHYNRIHQFTFLEASRESVEEWVAFMEILLTRIDKSESILMMLDMQQSGMLPLTTVHTRLHKLFDSQKDRPKGKIALILPEQVSVALANSILQIFSHYNEAQSFATYDSAWDWISRQSQ
jgi:hypothetical protein